MAAASSAGEDTAPPLSKPLICGSCAYWLGKRAEETKSHEWTVYVRAQSPDEDLSVYIRRVVFQLHPSFNPSSRGARQAA